MGEGEVRRERCGRGSEGIEREKKQVDNWDGEDATAGGADKGGR